jgi:hypothetical protein
LQKSFEAPSFYKCGIYRSQVLAPSKIILTCRERTGSPDTVLFDRLDSPFESVADFIDIGEFQDPIGHH